MIGILGDNHLSQQSSTCVALLDRLRRLGRRFYRATASILLANLFDDDHLRRNVFVTLTRLLADRAEVLRAGGAMLFGFGQVVLNAFTFQVCRQRTTAMRLALFFVRRRRGRSIIWTTWLLAFVLSLSHVDALRFQFGGEESQLIV